MLKMESEQDVVVLLKCIYLIKGHISQVCIHSMLNVCTVKVVCVCLYHSLSYLCTVIVVCVCLCACIGKVMYCIFVKVKKRLCCTHVELLCVHVARGGSGNNFLSHLFATHPPTGSHYLPQYNSSDQVY